MCTSASPDCAKLTDFNSSVHQRSSHISIAKVSLEHKTARTFENSNAKRQLCVFTIRLNTPQIFHEEMSFAYMCTLGDYPCPTYETINLNLKMLHFV